MAGPDFGQGWEKGFSYFGQGFKEEATSKHKQEPNHTCTYPATYL
jgi:hypothetical protein